MLLGLQSWLMGVSGVGLTSLMVWLLAGGMLALLIVIALLSRARAMRRMDRHTRRESKIDPWTEAANRLRLKNDEDSGS